MKVDSIMTEWVATLSPDDTAADAAKKMRMYDIGALPVCRDGELLGILTDRDIVLRAFAPGENPMQTPVKNLMSSPVITARHDMDVEFAAELMAKSEVRRLPVTEDGRLVGMLSLGDFAANGDTAAQADKVVCRVAPR